jgi:hypothetical protein
MPSASLLQWQNDRMRRLGEVDAQCATSLALVPPRPHLVEENLRGYVLLLSAHFQGFCRDLYTECAQIIASKVRPRLQLLIQVQFTAHHKLDYGNPNVENIRADFERFGFNFDLAGADPANPGRITHLGRVNRWRNVAAHHGAIPAAIPLDLPSLRDWRTSCNGLAVSLDDLMYDELRRILRRAPWVP